MAGSKGSGSSLPWFGECAGLKERIGRVFRRAEPRRAVVLLREGRIGVARKKGWQLADYAGDPAPWRRPAVDPRFYPVNDNCRISAKRPRGCRP